MNMVASKLDEFFHFLNQTAQSVVSVFGTYCETAVYQVEENASRILSIYNSKVTSRNVGDPFESLPKTEIAAIWADLVYNFYHGINENRHALHMNDGKVLKVSITHYVHEETGTHYALSVIFDATVFSLAEYALQAFNHSDKNEDFMEQLPDHHFGEVSEDDPALDNLFEACHRSFGVPIYNMKKKERLEFVALLKSKNVFSYQKSIPFVAERLHVSRYSIYNYLKELESVEH